MGMETVYKNRDNTNDFILSEDGSPVDQGALGIDDGIASFKVFLAPL